MEGWETVKEQLVCLGLLQTKQCFSKGGPLTTCHVQRVCVSKCLGLTRDPLEQNLASGGQ